MIIETAFYIYNKCRDGLCANKVQIYLVIEHIHDIHKDQM